jgi:hypothetical protein
VLFPYLLLAIVPEKTPECKALYEEANQKWIELAPLFKVKVASKVTWDLIHTYLDAASLTLSKCEPKGNLDFCYVRELKQGMKRANKERYNYQVWTYESMVAKARREGKCTNIYRSYGK